MLTDPWFYAAALPAVSLYGLSKGGLAGVGLLAMPVMCLIVQPFQAAAVMLPVLLAQDLFSIWSFRRVIDWEVLRYTLPGAAIGIALAFASATAVSPDQVRIGVGLLAIIFSLNAWFGGQRNNSDSLPNEWRAGALCGALSGFASFVIHAGGAPFTMYALKRSGGRDYFVGSSTIFFAVVNALKIPGYSALGQFTRENLTLSLVLLPVAIAANAGGIWLVRRISTAMFYRVVYALTFAVGLKLLYDGLFAR